MSTIMFTDGYTFADYENMKMKGREIDPNQIIWVNQEEANSILKQMSPEEQLLWIHTQIFYRVSRSYPVLAPKITGMIIELEQDILVYLITNQTQMDEYIKKAFETLKEAGMIAESGKLMSESVTCGEQALMKASGLIHGIPIFHANPFNNPYYQPYLYMPMYNIVPTISAAERQYLIDNGSIIEPPRVNSKPIGGLVRAVAQGTNETEKKKYTPKENRRVRVNLDPDCDGLTASETNIKCTFCNEKGHYVRSSTDASSEVICPTLRAFKCQYCHQTGHTKKMCKALSQTVTSKL